MPDSPSIPSPVSLKEAATAALQSKSVEESVLHLSRAFALFAEESDKLKNAYAKLQERFQSVNQELSVKVAELEKLTHYLNNILKHVSDAIVFIDLEGHVILFNDAAEKLLKVNKQKVLFQKFQSAFADDFLGFSMKEALKFGICHKLLYCKDMEISTTFVYQGPKIYHGMVVVLRDISERQKLSMQAARNDRMQELGQMAASVAHEIRNPLGGIRGYASLLYRDLQEQKHLQEMAGNILEGAKSLEKVVSAILHFSRPVQIDAATQDIGAFLRQTARFLKVDPAFPNHVKFDLHIPNAPLLVPFDPTALKAALLNLLFNALQAMPDGGLLTLALGQSDSHCQISISDTGVGMEEEMLSQLFSPFFTTKKKGNGLGLIETQKIVQAHFGSIDVRSRLNAGTTFTVHLPLKR